MYQKSQLFVASAGLILSLCAAPLMAQSSGDSKMPMSKTSEKDKMAMDKMSKEEKAAMFDKMSDADKMAATKMAGHDMSKMSEHDRMATAHAFTELLVHARGCSHRCEFDPTPTSSRARR